MTVDVELHAFRGGGMIRPVDLPDNLLGKKPTRVLPWVWYHGQNDHQPKQYHSVSMGDVIRFAGRRYIIRAVGFKPVADDYLPTEADWLKGEQTGCF